MTKEALNLKLNMTKKAMQQALDVLRHCLEHPDAEDAIAALEAAIAQPVQPPQRPWVGLTEKEYHTCTDGALDNYDLWAAIETKLKDKNK